MNRRTPLDGFHFDDQRIFNDQIGSEGIDKCKAAIADRNGNLPQNGETAVRQGMGKHGFIDRFEQSGSEFLMNMETAVDRRRRQFFNLHRMPSRLCAFA